MRNLLYLFLFSCLAGPSFHAQGIKIQSVRANVGEILVDYTLDNPKTAHQIKLQLDYEGQTWTPNSVFGDAGHNITGPTSKTLRWDAGKEGKEINGPHVALINKFICWRRSTQTPAPVFAISRCWAIPIAQ